ncbi:FadR/GntR family transcriptional regulator [Bacillus sp. B15-48]|uniref:FadR/GntR family transcriptional regulator n=1 Tax=Bacillus sp. B15-48 TaxID=1548601 RepID=UPI00193F8631|nr:FadR/GntR family transcriptional regulator [Bacillus sp. B15-48]
MKNRSEELVEVIGKKIVTGEYASGEILPKVEDLSEIHGVSRTVVRESLKSLATMGLVRSNQRSGTIVLPRLDWQWWNLDILTWEIENNNKEFWLHLTEVRLGLEPVVASLAAKRATDQDMVKITDAFYRLEQSIGDKEAWASADLDFHESILHASYNELIINTGRTLSKALLLSREKTIQATEKFEESSFDGPTKEALKRHRSIYEAVLARDGEKAQAEMTNLILDVMRIIEFIYNDHS